VFKIRTKFGNEMPDSALLFTASLGYYYRHSGQERT